MEDRVPKYPGRVKLEPVEGQPNVFDVVRADEPVVEGTALNKANLLSDSAAAQLGFQGTENPTVNDAFLKMAKFMENSPYLPLAGGTMSGLLTLSGAPVNDLHAASKQYVDTAVNSNRVKFIHGVASTDQYGSVSVTFGGIFTETPFVGVTAQIDYSYSSYENFAKTPMICENTLEVNRVSLRVKQVKNATSSNSIVNEAGYCRIYWFAIGE